MHHYLVQNLINVENAYCASLELSLRVRSECEISAILYDVPAQQFEYPMRGSTVYCRLKNPKHDQTSEIRERFFQSISRISESESFDMIYLRSFMDKATRDFRETLEEDLHSHVANLNSILAGAYRLAEIAREENKTRENFAGFLMKTLLYENALFSKKKFLPLWIEIIFNSNNFIGGNVISIEDIVQQSNRDLISATIFMGVENYFQRFATLKLRVVMENYNKLSEWSKIFTKQISLDLNSILAGAGCLADIAREDKKTREILLSYEHIIL
uniref:Uncharacterized protein n=1 Tax=Meloidogyne javanica TaxID=6303 RepID=A0A915MBE3_MELJA